MLTEPRQQIALEEDPAVLVPAERALLSLLEGYGPRACLCCNNVTVEARLGEADGPGGLKVLAAIWEHGLPEMEAHWRREVPLH